MMDASTEPKKKAKKDKKLAKKGQSANKEASNNSSKQLLYIVPYILVGIGLSANALRFATQATGDAYLRAQKEDLALEDAMLAPPPTLTKDDARLDDADQLNASHANTVDDARLSNQAGGAAALHEAAATTTATTTTTSTTTAAAMTSAIASNTSTTDGADAAQKEIPIQNHPYPNDPNFCQKETSELMHLTMPQFRDMRVIVNQTAVPTENGALISQSEYLEKNPVPADAPNVAACRFSKPIRMPWTIHFPHFLQQMVRCVSFWVQNPDKERVLVYPNHPQQWPAHFQNPGPNLYRGSQSFLTILQEAFQVRIVTSSDDVHRKTVSPRVGMLDCSPFIEDIDMYPYNVYRPTDMQVLGDAVRKRYDIPLQAGCPTTGEPLQAGTMPKIAILNRQRNIARSLLNDVSMIKYLKREIPGLDDVPMVFFENKTMQEQIAFFSSYDIVISPHGAQLATLPFLPPRGAILELFAPGYVLPQYFGSLAISSGLNHGYLYMTSGNLQQEIQLLFVRRLMKGKRQKVCTRLPSVRDALLKMIEQWRQSCALPADVEYPYPERATTPTAREWKQLESRLSLEREVAFLQVDQLL